MTRTGRKATCVVIILVLTGGAGGSGVVAGENDLPVGETHPALAAGVKFLAVWEPNAETPVIDLQRTIVLKGTVVDSRDRPIPDAKLYLSIDAWNDPVELGTSDADGAYRFDMPAKSFHKLTDGSPSPKVRAWLIAVAEGFGPAWANLAGVERDGWQVMEHEYVQDFRLGVDCSITGRIVDPDGKPVAGAVVAVNRIHELADPHWFKMPAAIATQDTALMTRKEADVNNWNSPLHRSVWRLIPPARTDAEGRFQLAGAGADRAVKLHIEGPGVEDAYASVLTRGDVDDFAAAMRSQYPRWEKDRGLQLFGTSPTIVVDRAPTVAGVVRDAITREPIAGVRIVVKNGRNGYPSSTTTDSRGRFRVLREASRDPVDVSALPWNDELTYLPVVRRFAGSAEPNEIVADFLLPHGVLVTGRVVEERTDRPIISASVYPWDAPWPGTLRTGHVYYYPLATNTALGHLPTGLYFADAPARRANHHLLTAIGSDGRFRIAVPPGPGVLFIRSSPGRPNMAAFGGVWRESAGFHRLAPYETLTSRTPDDGAPAGNAQSLPGINGPITIENSFHAYRVISPPADVQRMDLTLSVRRAPSRTLRFVGPDGNAINGVRVRGLAAESGMTIVLDDAEVEMVALDPNEPRQLTAISSDGKLIARTFVGVDDPQPTTIRLEPAATLTGRLRGDSTGRPLADYTVFINYPVPDSVNEKRTRSLTWPLSEAVTTDAAGRFYVGGLFPNLGVGVSFRAPRGTEPILGRRRDEKPESLQNLTLGAGESRNLGDVRIKRSDEKD